MKYIIQYDDSKGNRRDFTVSEGKPKLYESIEQAEEDKEKFKSFFDDMSIEEYVADDIDEAED